MYNSNTPFIDLKCAYYTHCKYSYNSESDIFTTEIDVAHLTNIFHMNTSNITTGQKEVSKKSGSHENRTPANYIAAIGATSML
jgi:hypothetical protein